MDKNKIIIDNCPNFYKIINFDYFADDMFDDMFTDKLIKIYRMYIFSINPLNDEEISKIKSLDEVLAKYIDDYTFRKTMKNQLLQVKFNNRVNLLQNLVNSIIGIFEKYEEGQTRNIFIARWI